MTAIDLASGKISKVSKSIQTLGTTQKEVTTTTDKFNNILKQQEKITEGLPRRFQMHYLSVMFFGMNIQRTFMLMARSATQAYLKITEGQTSAAQSLIALSAGFTYLSFSVGEALGRFLEPFIPTILSIIESLSDWISQNETLVSGLIIFGIILGTLLFTIGTVRLGMMGLITLLGIGGMASSVATLGSAWEWLTIKVAVGSATMEIWLHHLSYTLLAFSSSLLGTALIGAAAAILLYLAWENNLLGIKSLTYDVFAGVARTLLIIVQGVINLMWVVAKAGAVFGIFGTGTQKIFSDLANQLQQTSIEWQKFIDFTTTPEARTGIITSRPLSDLIRQSIGEIQNYITTTPTAVSTGQTQFPVTTINTNIDEINISSTHTLTDDEIERMIKSAIEDANAKAVDEIRRYTNVTVGR